MRLICISDTHTMERSLKDVPDGDVLIHAGDVTGRGSYTQLLSFIQWMKEQPHKHKILVAGNHDWCFANDEVGMCRLALEDAGIIYLEDSEIVIDGIKFYGSPWQPEFCNWAFNLPEHELKVKWDMISDDTNVLITHGPPHTIRDLCAGGWVGSTELLNRVRRLEKLKCHVFGHIHEGYGVEEIEDVFFVNASTCTGDYRPVNKPIVIDI